MSKLFKDILAELPAVTHLAALELLQNGQLQAGIENKPGQAGSLAVYHALLQRFGPQLDAAAAEAGLALYAEHTDDARQHPGKHPNIDRLLAVAVGGAGYQYRLQPA